MLYGKDNFEIEELISFKIMNLIFWRIENNNINWREEKTLVSELKSSYF